MPPLPVQVRAISVSSEHDVERHSSREESSLSTKFASMRDDQDTLFSQQYQIFHHLLPISLQFIGLILLPIVGIQSNTTAIEVACKDKMDLAISVPSDRVCKLLSSSSPSLWSLVGS